jgi:hypothetical protein
MHTGELGKRTRNLSENIPEDMEAAHSSETSVSTHKTTQYHSPKAEGVCHDTELANINLFEEYYLLGYDAV